MGELRKDPILGRWVIIASERADRPGAHMSAQVTGEKTDPAKCPFCVGHESMTPPEIYALREYNTKPNTPGWKVRVVPNKYPALGIDHPLVKKGKGLYDMMTNFGAHEVIIEITDHEREAKDQSVDEIMNWLTTLQYRIEDLNKDQRFRYLLIFKNKGKSAGASLSHPHHQIIATPVTPKRVREELAGALDYYRLKERCVFCDVMEQEKNNNERVVCENDAYISFCPYASRFPYEIWILPKIHAIDFYAQAVRDNLRLLAEHLKVVLQKLSGVLGEAEYNYLIHAAPNRFARSNYWRTIEYDFHWHIELFPRLTNVAGFEWGTGFYINPVSPEDAARQLREVQLKCA